MWWALAYIDEEESFLELRSYKGREVFRVGNHCYVYNSTKSIHFGNVKNLDAIKTAVNQGKKIECDVDDKDNIVAWREEK